MEESSYIKPSIFRSIKEQISEMFLAERADEFEKFEAIILNESDVSNKNRMHLDRLESVKLLHQQVAEHLGFLKTADFAQSVYSYLANNGGTIDHLMKSASELSDAEFLARHADKILSISAKAVADYEAGFAAFRKSNAVTLKKLGLLPD